MNIHLRKHFMDQQHSTNRGFIVLMSTLIAGAIGIAITASIILLGLSSSRSSFTFVQHRQAYWAANGCVEEALGAIRDTTSYVGGDSFSIGQGTCTYIVTDTGGETRTISAEGIVGNVYSRLFVVVADINPEIIITSWQEVAF